MNVVIIHEGRLIGAHPDYSHAHRRLFRYPVGSRVVRVKGAVTLAVRAAEMRMPHIGFTQGGRFHFFQHAAAGTGDGHAGFSDIPSFATVRAGRAA